MNCFCSVIYNHHVPHLLLIWYSRHSLGIIRLLFYSMQWFLENELFIPLGSLLHIDGIRGEQFLTRNFPLVAHNILTANRVPRWIGTNNNFTWSIVRRVRWNKLIKAYWEHNIFRKDIVYKTDLFIILNFLQYYKTYCTWIYVTIPRLKPTGWS